MMIKGKVLLEVSVELEDVLAQIAYGVREYDKLLEVVKFIDRHQEDWGFTEMCYNYFASEMGKLAEEEQGQ